MAWSLRGNRPEKVPQTARDAIELGRGERLLSWARDDSSGATVVASNHRLYAVSPAGEVALDRPWHLVDAGSWSHEAFLLTVTWVDRQRPAQWLFREPTLLPETVRERVQASVVLAQHVDLGERRSARAVIRQDLAGGGLVEQVVLGRGVREATRAWASRPPRRWTTSRSRSASADAPRAGRRGGKPSSGPAPTAICHPLDAPAAPFSEPGGCFAMVAQRHRGPAEMTIPL